MTKLDPVSLKSPSSGSKSTDSYALAMNAAIKFAHSGKDIRNTSKTELDKLALQGPSTERRVNFDHQLEIHGRLVKKGDIVINFAHQRITFFDTNTSGVQYSIGAPTKDNLWHGTTHVISISHWRDWNPPQSIKGHRVTGGSASPTGARTIKLAKPDTSKLENPSYEIHGTNNPRAIPGAVSHGCTRLQNADVIDLADKVKVGATVFAV